MKKLLFCIGARSEAIKIAPLVLEALNRKQKVVLVLIESTDFSLKSFLNHFELKVDYDLQFSNDSATDLSVFVLNSLQPILKFEKPDLVFVQGDSLVTTAVALSSYYQNFPIVYIESGLRSSEHQFESHKEKNKKIISSIADYNFSSTDDSRQNLLDEGIRKNVWVTGNTGIDALRLTLEKIGKTTFSNNRFYKKQKIILMTCHNPENVGKPLESICSAVLKVVENNSNVRLIFQLDRNPHFESLVRFKLGKNDRIQLIEPQGYEDFTELMIESDIILTDSGGIEEEASFLHKPVFVLRDSTERAERVAAGVAVLVGSNQEKIIYSLERAIHDQSFYRSLQDDLSIYGDGYSSQRVMNFLNIRKPELKVVNL